MNKLLFVSLFGVMSCTLYDNIDNLGKETPIESVSYGRLDKFDEIVQDEFVLRAIAFSKNNDEKSYREILVYLFVFSQIEQ